MCFNREMFMKSTVLIGIIGAMIKPIKSEDVKSALDDE